MSGFHPFTSMFNRFQFISPGLNTQPPHPHAMPQSAVFIVNPLASAYALPQVAVLLPPSSYNTGAYNTGHFTQAPILPSPPLGDLFIPNPASAGQTHPHSHQPIEQSARALSNTLSQAVALLESNKDLSKPHTTVNAFDISACKGIPQEKKLAYLQLFNNNPKSFNHDNLSTAWKIVEKGNASTDVEPQESLIPKPSSSSASLAPVQPTSSAASSLEEVSRHTKAERTRKNHEEAYLDKLQEEHPELTLAERQNVLKTGKLPSSNSSSSSLSSAAAAKDSEKTKPKQRLPKAEIEKVKQAFLKDYANGEVESLSQKEMGEKYSSVSMPALKRWKRAAKNTTKPFQLAAPTTNGDAKSNNKTQSAADSSSSMLPADAFATLTTKAISDDHWGQQQARKQDQKPPSIRTVSIAEVLKEETETQKKLRLEPESNPFKTAAQAKPNSSSSAATAATKMEQSFEERQKNKFLNDYLNKKIKPRTANEKLAERYYVSEEDIIRWKRKAKQLAKTNPF